MMRFPQIRTLVATAALCMAGQAALAQQPARPVTETTPETVQQLRQILIGSGLTPEQIRARLRAQGYAENLLDPYLPGSIGVATEPGIDTYRAVRELSLADSTQVEALRRMQSDSSKGARDSLARDSLSSREMRSQPSESRVVVRSDVADSMARLDSGYNIYGLEVFRSSDSPFNANVNGPVDANYRLGPGDQLVLILTGDVEAAHMLEITREGFVVIPQVGQLFVANLTLGQLEDLLFARLGRAYSGVRRTNATTRFSVTVSRLRSNQIFVLGEVERPGSYMVSSAGTAITALYAAGGPTANGSMRDVRIKRGGQLVAALDLYDYLLRGDGSNDARLQTGDIVFVSPRGGRVRVVGEVIRPGTYELKAGETLADIVQSAGGFRPDASRRRVQIERILPPVQRTSEGRDRVTIDLESEQLSNGHLPQLPLEPGDVVRVFPVASRVRNTITVKGNVWAPGSQGLAPGMTIADALKLAGGPKPDVYLAQVLVTRLRPDSSRIQLRASLRDSTGVVLNDFALQEDDAIEVFSLTSFRPDRHVAIGGAVRKPGRYPFRQGMTMRDLILLAGGMQEGAYLEEAEVARLPEDRTGSATAVTIRAPLDSTYIFERRPGQPYVGSPGLQSAARGAPEFQLKPYDNVLVLRQPNWELQRTVTIGGEVRFPGQYALKSRSERLADLVERAGGLTDEAYPEGTVFTRSKDLVGRVAIDVPRALKKYKSPDNLLLMDGDQITIPQRSNVVTVRGAVNAPNVVAYVDGKDIEYYIEQAGGAARDGDGGKAYITQPSGKRETKSPLRRLPKPMPGSLVIVPTKDASGGAEWIRTAGSLAQVLLSFIAIFVAIDRL